MTSSIPRLSPTGLAVIVAAGLALYAGILLDLGETWMEDENYAHGILVPPIAGYLVWRKREALMRMTPSPSFAGLLIVAASLGVLILGSAAIELFLTRVSLVGVLVGLVIYLWGWAYLRALLFPLAFLLLMVPLPAIVFNQIAFPLQLVASRMGVTALQFLDIPVLREGNIIVLATTTLEVAEACSGIRSLISLLTLALVYGVMMERNIWVRALIAGSAVPIAIVANGVRVAGAGWVAHYYGAEMAVGFLHGFSGWLLFTTSFAAMVLVEQFGNALTSLRWGAPFRRMAASV